MESSHDDHISNLDNRLSKFDGKDVDQVSSKESVSASVPEASPSTLEVEAMSSFSSSSSGKVKGNKAMGKKKMREVLKSADARTTSDPYNAYKLPQEKKETSSAENIVMGYPGKGTHVVLRSTRVSTLGQYTGSILSGPMQSPGPQCGPMQRNNPDSDMWQRATDFQKGLMPSPQNPMKHKAERMYKVGEKIDDEQAKQRQLKGIIYKLTPQNVEKLVDQVKEVNINNVGTLSGVIDYIFDKALMESTSVEMYAHFCSRLAMKLPDFSENNEKITFKRLLLNKCQEEFERREREEQKDNGKLTFKARRRLLGNIRLIGELYKKKMLTERIMHECIQKLLGQYENPDEENIEALCKLMSTIGEMIDHSKAKEYMDSYFEGMFKLSNNTKLSSRVRFMLKDAIDLRKNKWQQRRKVEGPKKIEEVHWDAAQERQSQSNRLARGPNSNLSLSRGQPMVFGPEGSSTPPEQARASTPPQSGTSDKVLLSEDRLHYKSIQMIKEFYSARDEKEVALCIKDLNAPSFYPSLISIWVTDSFERKDIDRDLLAKLLINLVKSQDRILSQDSLVRGFESVLSTLEDAMKDAPKAAEFLGGMFARLLLENVIPYKEVWRLIHEGGEEEGRLVEIGLAAEVLGVILEIVKAEEGDTFLDDLRANSNPQLESFHPKSIRKTLRLDKFI